MNEDTLNGFVDELNKIAANTVKVITLGDAYPYRRHLISALTGGLAGGALGAATADKENRLRAGLTGAAVGAGLGGGASLLGTKLKPYQHELVDAASYDRLSDAAHKSGLLKGEDLSKAVAAVRRDAPVHVLEFKNQAPAAAHALFGVPIGAVSGVGAAAALKERKGHTNA